MRRLTGVGAAMLAIGILLGFRVFHTAGTVLPRPLVPLGGVIVAAYALTRVGRERLILLTSAAVFVRTAFPLERQGRSALWCLAGLLESSG